MLGFLHFCAWGITGDQKIKKLSYVAGKIHVEQQ